MTNIPGKLSEELGSTWRSSPFVVGSQLMILALLGVFAYDRVQTRSEVLGFVSHLMEAQDQRNDAMVQRLNHLQEIIVRCYEYGRPEDNSRGTGYRARPPSVGLPE